MEDLQSSKDFFVAVDMEWPVNIANGIQGHVTVISLTFGNDIFILPVSLTSLQGIVGSLSW